ncbi:uncharacterized protein LTR77_006542 [Saxophila tyrrhenica]|uniref:mRNA export factor GLE1 n=1 Tax=Saxophila tyrrhenica TaxID=1690608 RepID=A0AAV9P4X2_9PEZI|nr:hypothetical protein LTR77_006542 [Saxophila tyrrhenica]
MSSPFRAFDRSPSSQRSTPSRNLFNGVKRVNGYHRSPRNAINDSPSRQILEEFSLMLLNDDRNFRSSLDEQAAAQSRLHIEALDRALAKHESVRESAERARERVELELERERRRLEAEERRAIEEARRKLEEQRLAEERKRLEEQQAREEAQRKEEALKRQQDEAKRKAEAERQQQEEAKAQKERQDKEEADRKARQDAEAKQRAQQAENERQTAASQAPAAAPQTNGTGLSRPSPLSGPAASAPAQASANLPQGLVSSNDEREAAHNAYLDLHKRLKQMREHVSNEVKKVPGLKDKLSDWRRSIKKCLGQLSKGTSQEAKDTNKRATVEITKTLDAAAQVSEPSIDITAFLVQNHQPPGANTQGPACLLFLLNHFVKNIINQLVVGSGDDLKAADSIGVLAVTIFARPQYLFNGQSLIDLLWAKYHKACPVLFGISGNERTRDGRIRLGWLMEPGSNTFIAQQQHYERMSGLGAGFAAITLRDFSRSKNANPAPNRLYWESLARITNTPAQATTPTHFIVLKGMVSNYVPRIINTFGSAGIAALRHALILFPNEKGPTDEKGRKVPAVTAVLAMPMVLQRELHLTL